ncbi:MAG: hypothetical protein HY778_18305 [Betaproteobacteria bacterium]|nr:hypothetical protein [Betaproteobacteria bacterium]
MADFDGGESIDGPVWEMSISRTEFERSLPDAVGRVPYRAEGDEFRWRDGPRRWWIRLTRMPDHRVALLTLPRHRVEFRFDGYTAREVDAFLRRFALYFRRGGG